jgi:hypothetical protein
MRSANRIGRSAWILAILLSWAALASADCLSLSGEVPGSACSASSDEVEWSNGSASPVVESKPSNWYAPELGDIAFTRGARTGGDALFDFRAVGKYLVEVFLIAADDGRGEFLLEADGSVVDGRYEKWTGDFRFLPRGRMRRIDLLAVVEGPVKLAIRSDVDDYLVSAIRWRPVGEFEAKVSQWLDEARKLHAKPLFHADASSPTIRVDWLHQYYSRLRLAEDADVRAEALLGLTRVFYWEAAENHEPRVIAQTTDFFREALEIAPDDSILRQMISSSCLRANIGTSHPMAAGEFCDSVVPVPWEVSVAGIPPDAPGWAASQIRLSRRMDAITGWWVDNQQADTGELGGGWEDDVEILRHWGPQALGFGSAVAARGLERIADGIWESGYIVDGYNRHLTDVEHSSEPTTDSQPLLAALHPDRREVLNRLRATRACADNWIGEQPDGRWRFHSAWFNCKQLDTSPERSIDVHLNVRAMGPALWYAALIRDPETVELLERWAESWLEAMRRTDHGKPPGILPSAVRAVDGSYLLNSEHWDKPEVEWDYFQWSGRSQEALASLFLALHDLTGGRKWLDAAGESFQVMAACAEHPALCEAIRDSPESFYEWRRRTGDARHDAAFGYQPPGRDEEILDLMARQARETEDYLAANFDMHTSEVLFTDRVYYRWPAEYRKFLFGGEAPRGERYPFFAVTWPESDTEFARAVVEAGPQRLRLRIFALGETGADIPVRFWRLRPGKYQWRTSAGASGSFTVARPPLTVAIQVPAGQDVSVDIIRPVERSH